MGLREKVTLTLVIILFIQITCRHCMPRLLTKSTLKGYPNNNKPIKNNPVPTSYSQSQSKSKKATFGKSQNTKPDQNPIKAYNFPEIEYPLDSSLKDPFYFNMNSNANNRVYKPRKEHNLQSAAINELKREMKMKRKLTSNRQLENSRLNGEMGPVSTHYASNSEPIRLLNSEIFPEVQYPVKAMDTWGPNYWNYLPFTQDSPQIIQPKVNENCRKTLTRLTKTKANQFLKSYDKLKEEHGRSTSSKRSDLGGKGTNVAKTATSERFSEDIITTSLLSSTNSLSNAKKTLTSNKELSPTEDNVCPDPYLIENKENMCPELNKLTKIEETPSQNNETFLAKSIPVPYCFESRSMDTVDISHEQTINTINSINCDAPSFDNIPPTKEYHANSSIDELTDKLIISNDTSSVMLQTGLTTPLSQNPDDASIIAGPLNDNTSSQVSVSQMSVPTVPDPPSNFEPRNMHTSYMASLPSLNTASGTSIIIIPFNNAVRNPNSQVIETFTETQPIILYIPTTQSSSITTKPLSLVTPISNSRVNNIPSAESPDIVSHDTFNSPVDITQIAYDNPSTNAIVSEIPLITGALSNYMTNTELQLPMFESLPRNSMGYNNENRPSSFREHLSSNKLVGKSLLDILPSNISSSSTLSNIGTAQLETCIDDMDIDNQSPSPDIPIFNFSNRYSTVLNDTVELPDPNFHITTVNKNFSDQLVLSKDEIPLENSDNFASNNGQLQKESISLKEDPEDQRNMNAAEEELVRSNVPVEPHPSNSTDDKLSSMKEALQNAILTIFPMDKKSLPVYNAVFKTLINNAPLKSQLRSENKPTPVILDTANYSLPTTTKKEVLLTPTSETPDNVPLQIITSSSPTLHNTPSQSMDTISKTQIHDENQSSPKDVNGLQELSHESLTGSNQPFKTDNINSLQLLHEGPLFVQPTETNMNGLPLPMDVTVIPTSTSDAKMYSSSLLIDPTLTSTQSSDIDIKKLPLPTDSLDVSDIINTLALPKDTTQLPSSFDGDIDSISPLIDTTITTTAPYNTDIIRLPIAIDTIQFAAPISDTNSHRLPLPLDIAIQSHTTSNDNNFPFSVPSNIHDKLVSSEVNNVQTPDISNDTPDMLSSSYSKDSLLPINKKINKPLTSIPKDPSLLMDELPSLMGQEYPISVPSDILTVQQSLLVDKNTDTTLISNGLTETSTVPSENLPIFNNTVGPETHYGTDNKLSPVEKELLDRPSLSQDDLLGPGNETLTVVSSDLSENLPAVNDLQLPINVSHLEPVSNILIEDSLPVMINDSLLSLDKEPLQRHHISEMNSDGHTVSHLSNELPYDPTINTSIDSVSFLMDDWKLPLDEILQLIKFVENSGNVTSPNKSLIMQANDVSTSDDNENISNGKISDVPTHESALESPDQLLPEATSTNIPTDDVTLLDNSQPFSGNLASSMNTDHSLYNEIKEDKSSMDESLSTISAHDISTDSIMSQEQFLPLPGMIENSFESQPLNSQEIELIDKVLLEIFHIPSVEENEENNGEPSNPEYPPESPLNTDDVTLPTGESRPAIPLTITKALLENVLFDIYKGSLSIPVPKSRQTSHTHLKSPSDALMAKTLPKNKLYYNPDSGLSGFIREISTVKK